jgi:hypothetical protein
MMTLRPITGSQLRLTLLALLTISTLWLPAGTHAAERDGTVLFFPLADVQHMIVSPSRHSLATLFSFSSPTSSFVRDEWSARLEQDNGPQRNPGYGNKVGGDRYPLPGPLWGY